MNISTSTHEKINAAYLLLQTDRITIDAFEHVRTVLKGIHPDIDRKLDVCSKLLGKLKKVQSGDVITLSVEALPEDLDEEKKRKKALLLFINSIKNLKSEIKRVEAEFTHATGNDTSQQNQIKSSTRILARAKGPLGIITLAAVLVIGFSLITHNKTQNNSTPARSLTKIQVILFGDKQIPLSELHIGQPHVPNCDSTHYHAITGHVTALDGTVLQDPGNCGFGKVKDVQIIEAEVIPSPSL